MHKGCQLHVGNKIPLGNFYHVSHDDKETQLLVVWVAVGEEGWSLWGVPNHTCGKLSELGLSQPRGLLGIETLALI